VFIIRGKYFKKAKRLVIYGPRWVLTARVPSKGSLARVLNYHRLKHRGRGKWEKVGDVYYSELIRR
jgi:hypothetical protein